MTFSHWAIALEEEQEKLREITAEERRIFEEKREERRQKAMQDQNTLKKVQASMDVRDSVNPITTLSCNVCTNFLCSSASRNYFSDIRNN